MGQSSKWRKVIKYIQAGDHKKMKSYLKKHKLNITTSLDEVGSLLHVACEAGQELVIRYLLKKGADVHAVNSRGEVPLHKALQFALKGDQHAYADIVEPVFHEWLGALDVKNHHRVTPRMLLAELETKNSGNSMDNRSAAIGNSSEDEWQRKLAAEAGDEYEAEFGKFQEDFEEDPEPSNYDNWADGIREAYRRKEHKRHQDQWAAHHKAKLRRRDTPEESEEKQRKREAFQRKLEEEHREYLRRAKTAKRKKFIDAKRQYDMACKELFSSDDVKNQLSYRDIPWPYLTKDKHKRDKYGCESKETTAEDAKYGCNEAGVKALLLCDIPDDDIVTVKKYLKEQQVRWHPDKFIQKCGHKLDDSAKDEIMERVNMVSQIINKLVKDLV